MDSEKRVALELAFEDRLRADLDALAVRPYVYYKEAAVQRLATRPGSVGRLFSVARVGATVVVAVLFALATAFALLNLRGPSAASPTPIAASSTTPAASPSPTPTTSSTATVSPLAAQRRCGTVTDVALTDPIGGGGLSIEGRTFLVGGLGTGNHLPFASDPNALQIMFRAGVSACVEGNFRVLPDGRVAVTNGSVGLLRDARAGDAVAVCGTLHSLDAPTETNNEGAASLADEFWFLSGTPGPNDLSPQATVRSNVCLRGTVAPSQTTRNLLIRWSLVPNAAQSPAPSATTAP